MKRIGVLLAAGESRRMGRPKQLLPWPPKSESAKPMVAAAYDAIARVCDEMFVVLGHESDAVMAALKPRKYCHYTFGGSAAEMFRSVRIGLAVAPIACKIDERELTQLLLQPADHPEVRLDTLQMLASVAVNQKEQAIMPQYRGRGGHPVLISQNVAKIVCAYDGLGGLRQFWLEHPQLCVRLPVDDPGVAFDVDTQADYDFYTS